MTMPTFLLIRYSDSTLQPCLQKIAYRCDDQLRRSCARVHVTLTSLAEERCATATCHHRDRCDGRFVRAYADITQRARVIGRTHLIERRHQHIEHCLMPDIGATERLDH